MIICAISRLCGIFIFSADFSKIKIPNRFLQELISALLLIFELTFVYRILCRKKWLFCILISILQAIACGLIGFLTNKNTIFINIFNMICIFIIPIFFVRNKFVIIESAILYSLSMLYCILFSVGRIGILDSSSINNFVYGVVSVIDFKLFFVFLYLFIKNFGGLKLWKKQKISIFRTDLT